MKIRRRTIRRGLSYTRSRTRYIGSRTRRSYRTGKMRYDIATGNFPLFTLMILFTIVAIVVVYVMYNRSFEPTTFTVNSKSWRTISELYHYEEDCYPVSVQDDEGNYIGMEIECDTDTVIDESWEVTGADDEQVTYVSLTPVYSDQYYRTSFHSTIHLSLESGEDIVYHAGQSTYERMPRGSHCYGQVGWFNHVRGVNCAGR